MGELTLSTVDQLGGLDEAERALQMTEEAFRGFYEQTARPLWTYLARMTGDDRLADDLLQETYYRFLRAKAEFSGDDHRRNYLFRIATNLVRDHRRRPASASVGVAAEAIEESPDHMDPHTAERAARRIDLTRALETLKPRERSLLWLAYAQGCSHAEIASSLGLRTGSLKALLFRARRRLLRALGETEARR
ncbi:MAG TPA: sigma-70 family RNA polymerase sigma factor [Vicinamibacterales bacterium]|nr:sigma-70 family RNA polymerase sigma factor [Vicinamibacterales bacterium]